MKTFKILDKVFHNTSDLRQDERGWEGCQDILVIFFFAFIYNPN